MKEWILQHTEVTEEEYDALINPQLVYMENTKVEDIPYIPYTPFTNPIDTIDDFTLRKPNLLRKRKYKIINEQDYYIHQNIKFYILAKMLKEMRRKLYTSRRYHKCCQLSFEVASRLNECNIVTALCTNPFNKIKQKFLHTFVIYIKEGEEYVIDATLNAIIKKEIYFRLYQPQIISTIPKSTIKEDFNIIKETKISDITATEYLCFKEPIMNVVKKLTKNKN